MATPDIDSQDEGPQPDRSTYRHPIPLALRLLIESQQKLLQAYQDELLGHLGAASAEMLKLLRLTNDGWQLNMADMEFVRPRQEGEELDDSPIN